MLKKIIPLVILAIIFTVTYQVTTKEESIAISKIKEKLQRKNSNKSPKTNTPSIETSEEKSTLSESLNVRPDPQIEKVPSEIRPQGISADNKKPEDPGVSSSLPARHKRILPRRETSPSGGKASDRSGSDPRSGGPGSPVSSGASIRTFIVSENGEGETYLLMEALRMLRSGDKLQVRKGTYTFLMNHLSIPDVDITGEGEETILEVPETLKLQQRNLTLKKLRLMNTGTSSAIEVSSGKKITAEDVALVGNGNDCITVIRGDLNLSRVKLERCNRGLFLRDSAPVINELEVSDSDYGVYFAGTGGFAIKGMKAETINLFSVFFTSESSGTITCTGCRLTENSSNRRNRLLLKK